MMEPLALNQLRSEMLLAAFQLRAQRPKAQSFEEWQALGKADFEKLMAKLRTPVGALKIGGK